MNLFLACAFLPRLLWGLDQVDAAKLSDSFKIQFVHQVICRCVDIFGCNLPHGVSYSATTVGTRVVCLLVFFIPSP